MKEAWKELFLAAMDADRRDQVHSLRDWSERLRRSMDAARVTASDIGLDDATLAAAMGERMQRHTGHPEDWFEHLHPEELALACGCAAGLPRALQRFEAQYAHDIDTAVRRFARPDLPAEDLRQQLLRKLFVTEGPEQPARISAYTGQGFLQNWLRVTATRTFIDAVRSRDAGPEIAAEDELIERVVAPGASPELELVRRQNTAHFKAAVAEAVGALDRSQRLLLKQHIVARLSIDQLAALYAIHRATAARRVAAAREALIRNAREALMRRMNVTEDQLDSIVGLFESRLDASVARLLDDG